MAKLVQHVATIGMVYLLEKGIQIQSLLGSTIFSLVGPLSRLVSLLKKKKKNRQKPKHIPTENNIRDNKLVLFHTFSAFYS